ncbi:hypothetical protein D3C81_2328590 [compost metagenome]
MLTGICDDFFKLAAVHGKRLLTENGFAGTERKQRILPMEWMRCPDIDSIHLRVIH